ncbi:hypothetical protein FPOA_06961 [Fusarium poae]|uniref:Xylanolytic transcriptional activator regulatory domain-containing protein n=1 Tax=Fusarium poae TaxID=36050 RepID=A0A1B8AJG8_FUSPO|nr:hypothetical protein FPOA_06961 [Fusarium poae]
MSSPHGAGTSNASTIAADDTSGQSLEMHTQPQIAMAEEPSEAAIHDAEGSTNDFWQLAPSRNFMQQESDTAFTLSHVLGPFAIDVTGTAPYLRSNVDTRQGEVPVIEDFDEHESLLPIIMPTPGRKVSIPLEMMPDEETALRYFDLYFTHVHPYVPVLSKGIFYQQWYTDRESISPLILEAIFAISGRLAEESTKGQQWLALFSKHLDYFMDAPRLSTLQALLMILKAREAVTRQGYYYRSWTTVVQCIQMGKDLGLDEHFKHHQAGRPCSHILPDCRLRTQIWRVIFVCEVMVGAPQGN